MKPKHGEVVAWSDTTLNNDHKRVPTTIIAIADDDSSFVVALNYHEEGRLWDVDSFPEGAKIRKADTIEAGYLLATLMEHDYHIVVKDGIVYACCPNYETIEELSASATRSWLFNQYVNALIRHYNTTGSLNGMSKIRDKHKCTGITKAQFYELRLNELDAIKNYYPQNYTDAIFAWATGKTNLKPMFDK